MIELPVRDPCDLCETAAREDRQAIIEEGEHTLTVINPWQFEVGQCCVITRRHVATLLDLSRPECEAILVAGVGCGRLVHVGWRGSGQRQRPDGHGGYQLAHR